MESEFPPGNKMPPKSNEGPKQNPPKEPVEKVIEGVAVERKMPLGKRFMKNFNGADSKSVAKWVFGEVIVPTIKKLIYESFTSGLQMKLFGQAQAPRSGVGGFGQQAYTAYNRMTAPMVSTTGFSLLRPDPREQQGGQLSPQARQMHDFKEILIPSRAEALVVLEYLYSQLHKFEVVSVSDFYAACGITPAFTDERWGWYSLEGSDVSHTTQGWLLDLPQPTPIN